MGTYTYLSRKELKDLEANEIIILGKVREFFLAGKNPNPGDIIHNLQIGLKRGLYNTYIS